MKQTHMMLHGATRLTMTVDHTPERFDVAIRRDGPPLPLTHYAAYASWLTGIIGAYPIGDRTVTFTDTTTGLTKLVQP